MNTSSSGHAEHPFLALLNNGLLPFTGREEAVEELLAFCRRAETGEGLAACVVAGEAGIGKSWLASALAEELRKRGRRPLPLRLYPDASLDIERLCALALHAHDTGVLNLSPVEQLRRRAQVAPLVLIVEDAHLLLGQAVRAFADLLHSLADLPVPLLIFTRPLSVAQQGVVEPYRSQEILLQGFGPDEVAALWGAVFGEAVEREVVEEIAAATKGNPLALRSGLRMVAESVARSGEARAPREHAGALAHRGAVLLAEGLLAHLTPEERRAAEVLAVLGEVFDRNVAAALLGEDAPVLDQLVFKGVAQPITHGGAAVVVGRTVAGEQLAFSHTLIHQLLLDAFRVESAVLIGHIAAGAVLYSITPFRLLARAPVPDSLPPSLLFNYLQVVGRAMYDRYLQGDLESAGMISDAYRNLLAEAGHRLAPDDRLDLELNLRRYRLNDLRGRIAPEEYRREVDTLLEETAHLPEGLLRQRIGILRYKQALEYHTSLRGAVERGVLWEAWDEVKRIAARSPEVCTTQSFALFLGTAAQVAVRAGSTEVLRELRAEVARVAQLDNVHPSVRRALMSRAMVRFAFAPATPEEEREALETLRRIEAEYHDPHVTFRRMMAYYGAGNFDMVRQMAENLRVVAEKRGMWMMAFASEAQRLLSRPDAVDTAQVIEEILSHYRFYGERIVDTSADEHLSSRVFTVALLHGRLDLVAHYAEQLGETAFSAPPEISLLVALRLDPARFESVWENTVPATLINALGEMVLGRRERLPPHLLDPSLPAIVRTPDLTDLWIARGLLAHLEAGNQNAEALAELRGLLNRRVLRLAEWLNGRGLGGLALVLTERKSSGKGARGGKGARASSAAGATVRRELTVMGAFALRDSGGLGVSITGRRMQAIVGAVVADALLGGVLERRELVELATGEPYTQAARKVLNNGVKRLRELLGQEVIATDADGLPRLNGAVLDVDVLLQERHRAAAQSALRSRALARAAESLESALTLALRGVPFPALYDPLYDRLRDDLESGLRDVALRVVRALLDADALEPAEHLTSLAVRTMPGDEELVEIRRAVLERRNASAQAEIERRREHQGNDED